MIEVTTNKVYELQTEYDAQNFYFNFLTPHEVYDKVVVIDAGHGGRAVGANKQGINEKDIDLAIVLKLKEIFDNSDQNIGVYYTRTDDSNPTFDQRVQLANKSDADLFISIHNNSTRSGRMSGTSGTPGDDTTRRRRRAVSSRRSVWRKSQAGSGAVTKDWWRATVFISLEPVRYRLH